LTALPSLKIVLDRLTDTKTALDPLIASWPRS